LTETNRFKIQKTVDNDETNLAFKNIILLRLYRMGESITNGKENVSQQRQSTLMGRVSCKQAQHMLNLTRGCYRVGRPCLNTLGGGRGAACWSEAHQRS